MSEYPRLTLALALLGAVSSASFVLKITRILLQIFVIPGKSVRFSQTLETVKRFIFDGLIQLKDFGAKKGAWAGQP